MYHSERPLPRSRDHLRPPLQQGFPQRSPATNNEWTTPVRPRGYKAVLRIHDILGWIRIRIRGSMPLTNGSGSGSWIRILPFLSLTFKMPAKNLFFNTIFSAYYFLKLHLHHFSKINSKKESQNSKNQGFSYYFCMTIEGSGSGRPRNMWIRWIRIRIRNTVTKRRRLSWQTK